MKVTVVAGNPKRGSRTLTAAKLVAQTLSGSPASLVVDVVDLGSGLLEWSDQNVSAAVEAVASSDLAVIASPTFKGTYCGLLKLFLDRFDTGVGLQDVVTVPLMLGASPAHSMAPDVCLRPVLAELGSSCPAPGLYSIDSSFLTDGRIEEYCRRWSTALLTLAQTSVDTSVARA